MTIHLFEWQSWCIDDVFWSQNDRALMSNIQSDGATFGCSDTFLVFKDCHHNRWGLYLRGRQCQFMDARGGERYRHGHNINDSSALWVKSPRARSECESRMVEEEGGMSPRKSTQPSLHFMSSSLLCLCRRGAKSENGRRFRSMTMNKPRLINSGLRNSIEFVFIFSALNVNVTMQELVGQIRKPHFKEPSLSAWHPSSSPAGIYKPTPCHLCGCLNVA